MDYPKFLQDFLYYLRTIKGRSEMTTKEYGYDIYNLSRFLFQRANRISDDDFSIADMQPDFFVNTTLVDLHAYMGYLDVEKQNSARTRARKAASIRTFFRYLIHIINLPMENIAERLETPKSVKRHPIYLTLHESEDLLDQVFKNEKIKKKYMDEIS